MGDLEDRILKKNIPGKYSWWDEYQEGGQQDDDADQLDAYGGTDNEPVIKHVVEQPTRQTSTKAGIKGVLENYKLDKEEAKRQAQIDRMEKEEIIERKTLGAKLKPGEVSISLNATLEQQRKQVEQQRLEDRSDADDDDDDDFIARYRQQRIRELQQHSESKQYAGGVQDVDPAGYSKAVDETDPRVLLVVHVYETYIPDCRTLANILESISRREGQMRFLSLKASSFSQTLEPAALPAVLIHKGGALVANLTPITSHLPAQFWPKDVSQLLSEYTGPSSTTTNEETGILGYAARKVEAPRELDYDNGDSDAELDEFCKDFDGAM
jgi:hypothetical protein